jgi:hypothetical protein
MTTRKKMPIVPRARRRPKASLISTVQKPSIQDIMGKHKRQDGFVISPGMMVEVLDSLAEDIAKNEIRVNALEEIQRKKAEDRIAKGDIKFEDVMYLFKPGDEVVFDHHGKLMGGIIEESILSESQFFGSSIILRIQCLTHDGMGLQLTTLERSIPSFAKTCSPDKLPIHKITREEKTALKRRGRMFKQFYDGSHYRENNNTMYVKSIWNHIPISCGGKCVIDTIMACKEDNRIFSSFYGWDVNTNLVVDGRERVELIDSMLWMTLPYLPAFSFRQKQWGWVAIDECLPVKFSKSAFDTLVLENDKKLLIRALVERAGTGFMDIISGKSGGFIFLLHGEPGTGKTLTAESVAEALERPLYVISVGELGTTPELLEDRLRSLLELATRWNAVVLLDEADIFLEKRDSNNLDRNAMVGIFLRMLEYFNGVLFLTTNRVNNFDPAFHSRISLALHYPAMTDELREQIWKNLLAVSKIAGISLKMLRAIPLNGRQIKNTIRLTQAVANSENIQITEEALVKTAKMAGEFLNSLER